MSGTHGDLYCEIGALVVAANAGQSLDLAAASEDLSHRYASLNVPPDAMARAIARSLGAVGVSMALLKKPKGRAENDVGGGPSVDDLPYRASGRDGGEPKSLFPSGVRLALLS